MAGILDFFTGANTNAPSPAPAPANSPAPNPPAPSPAPNAPAPAPADPMDIYAHMWDNPTNTDAAPSFTLDPKVMDGIVAQQDFMQGVDPALMQKAQAGDAMAMTEMMQHVGRQAYKAAMSHNSLLTDKFVGAREKFNESAVDKRVRGELTNQQLGDIPNAKNPVVRQQLRETAERLQRQHPDAPPREIAKMTTQYFQDLLSAINPQAKPDPVAESKKVTENWDKFFDEPQEQ